MNINCPCGPKCVGSDKLGRAPECYKSFEGESLPGRFMIGKSFIGTLAGAALLGVAEGFAKGLASIDIGYEVYQCPSCGCEVVFRISQVKGEFNRRRMGDSCDC